MSVQSEEQKLKEYVAHEKKKIAGVHANLLKNVALTWCFAEVDYKKTRDKNEGINNLHYTNSVILWEDGTWKNVPKGEKNKFVSCRLKIREEQLRKMHLMGEELNKPQLD